jgi:hypothetical protein
MSDPDFFIGFFAAFFAAFFIAIIFSYLVMINYFFLLLAALILSMRLGYGRPAALAIAFAFDLAFGESFFGFAFGLGLSQTCFFVAILLAVPLS